ncbi:acyl-CoA synthetase FdrA [Ignatzschineria ureiclastica]|nr:acyl-CoA synthetase FdrA [Ignatzschineria ureiclastica]
MIISRKLSEHPEVEEISVMMGTPANKDLLKATGFWSPEFEEATPNDICIAIKAETTDNSIVEMVVEALEEELANLAKNQGGSGKRIPKARRLASALERMPDSNTMLISIAGEYAADLTESAIEKDLNVMIFSDNMSLQDEIRLKKQAADKGLIVMGPDCGTSMIAGAPLAFANVIPEGNIGVVGASGTGIQELCSQIALAGQGITHAIGLGGRDLSVDVGGVSAMTALDMLENDENTKVIAFVSKPPAEEVRQKIIQRMKSIAKPVVALFLGSKIDQPRDGNVHLINTIDKAARLAAELSEVEKDYEIMTPVPESKILGLYTGGTLAAEIALILAEGMNAEIDSKHEKGTMLDANGHKIIDLGDDFYTVGRPHPMIDPTSRQEEIIKLANRPEIGVVLLDVVIGYGAGPAPAESVVSAIKKLREKRQAPINFIATVTGTNQDPQGRDKEIELLKEAGIAVVNNLPEAAALAFALITPRQAKTDLKPYPLLEGVKVINAGLRSFSEDLQSAGIPVVQFQWAPIAGGNQQLANILKRLK